MSYDIERKVVVERNRPAFRIDEINMLVPKTDTIITIESTGDTRIVVRNPRQKVEVVLSRQDLEAINKGFAEGF